MAEEASFEFRLRKIDETRNYLLDEIEHHDWMSEKYEKTFKYLNYIEHLLQGPTFFLCFSNLRLVSKKNLLF